MSGRIAWWTLALATIAVGWGLLEIVRPLFVPLLLGVVLALLCRPLHERLTTLFRGRRRLAAVTSTLLVLVSVVTPIAAVVAVTGERLLEFTAGMTTASAATNDVRPRLSAVSDELTPEQYAAFQRDVLEGVRPTQALPATAPERAARPVAELEAEHSDADIRRSLRSFGVVDLLAPEESPRIQRWRGALEAHVPPAALDRLRDSVNAGTGAALAGVSSRTQAALSNVVQAVVGMGILAVTVYYLLADGPQIAAFVDSFLPLDVDDERSLVRRFEEVCRGILLGTLASAAMQGILMGIGLAVAGVPNAMLLSLLTAVAGVVPVFGTVVVWVPVAVWLCFEERYLAALFVAAYGATVVASCDNLVRAYALRGRGRLHPLVGLISMVGGVQAMGLWGIVLGPIVAGVFYALISLLRQKSEESRRPTDKMLEMRSTGAPSLR